MAAGLRNLDWLARKKGIWGDTSFSSRLLACKKHSICNICLGLVRGFASLLAAQYTTRLAGWLHVWALRFRDRFAVRLPPSRWPLKRQRRRRLGVRRLDAAVLDASAFEGGVEPPHSKALRAFSWFRDARQPLKSERPQYRALKSEIEPRIGLKTPIMQRNRADNAENATRPDAK